MSSYPPIEDTLRARLFYLVAVSGHEDKIPETEHKDPLVQVSLLLALLEEHVFEDALGWIQ